MWDPRSAAKLEAVSTLTVGRQYIMASRGPHRRQKWRKRNCLGSCPVRQTGWERSQQKRGWIPTEKEKKNVYTTFLYFSLLPEFSIQREQKIAFVRKKRK